MIERMLKLRAPLPQPEAPAFMNAAVELMGTETKTRRYALTYVDSLGVIERQRFVEIAQRAGRWADLLRRQGLEPGGRVVVLTERDRHWRTALVGVLEAGGVAVPCAASAPVDDICSLAKGTGAAGVASTFPRPDLAEAGMPVLCVDHLDSRQGRRANRFARTRPDDFALILHEHDGSRFHGAAYTHDALIEQASTRAQQLGVGEGQRLWCTAPEASVPSLWLALAAWHQGVELVTVEDELEPQTKLGLLDKIRPAALWLSDEEYGELAAAEAPWWVDLGSIRHAITTGEPGEGALAFQEAFGVTAAAAPVLMETLVIDASAPVQHAAPRVGLPTLGEAAPLNGAAEAANRLPPLLRRQEEAIILPRHELTAAEARRQALEAAAREEGRRRAEEVKRQDEERRREEQEARRREEQEARERRNAAKRRLEEETAQRKLAKSLDALLIGLDEKSAGDATDAEARRRADEGKAAEQRQRAEQAARAEERRRAAAAEEARRRVERLATESENEEKRRLEEEARQRKLAEKAAREAAQAEERRRAEEAEEARRHEERQAKEREKEEKRRLEEEAKQRKLAEKAAREAAQAEERRRAEEKKARERAEKAAANERRRAEEAARADERRLAEVAKRQEEERLRREKETQRRETQQAQEREKEEKRRLEQDAKSPERAARAAIEQRRRAEKAELIRRAAALVEARRRQEADRVRAGRRLNGKRDQGEELAPDVLSRISQYSAATSEVEQDGRFAANGSCAPATLPEPDARCAES